MPTKNPDNADVSSLHPSVGGPSQLSLANVELAYAENRTGAANNVTSVLQATPFDVAGCSIVVPPSSRPVYLQAALLCSVTVVTTVTCYITEVPNGTDPPITRQRSVALSTANGFVAFDWMTRLGTTLRPRTFKLQAQKGSSTASTMTIYVPDNVSLYWDLFIAAFCR